MSPPAVQVRGLDFRYAGTAEPALAGVSLAIPSAARCLVVGRNGAGKSTFLELLAGRRMVAEDCVRVLGRPAFHDASLAHRVSFIGGSFPFDADVRVSEILARQGRVDPVRRDRLVQTLGVDPAWSMCRVSSGQRRRVQILLGLLHPMEVLLLDEVTTDLDLIARIDLLSMLREDGEEQGITIVHATHIFDRLDGWATHLLHLEGGRVRRLVPSRDLDRPLLPTIEGWLREAAGQPDRT